MLPIVKTDRTLFEWQAMASVAKVVSLQFSLVIVRSFFIRFEQASLVWVFKLNSFSTFG